MYVQRSEVHCEGQAGGEERKEDCRQGNGREGDDPNQHARNSSGHGEQNVAK